MRSRSSVDEAAGRYRGLRGGQQMRLNPDDAGVVVKSQLARRQIDEDTKGEAVTRFGTIELDATRAGRDASRIADEVISHLSGLVEANVKVTLEIQAEIPEGAPEHVVRTVTENSRTLKAQDSWVWAGVTLIAGHAWLHASAEYAATPRAISSKFHASSSYSFTPL